MVHNKKASEGIALLSMYDDDEDDEMGKFEGKDEKPYPNEQENHTPPLQEYTERMKTTIVDYGHAEVATEQEEGEVSASGMLIDGEGLALTNGDPRGKMVHMQIQFSESNGGAEADVNRSPSAMAEDLVIATMEKSHDVDILNSFLPPPPIDKCSDELQNKITRFIQLKKQKGISFNAEVRNRKDYRNPDFLRHVVTYQDIDEIGSCFSKYVFDPHGYDTNDFYDELEADMKRELERKEQERKRSPKVEFCSGGTQIGIPTPKINLPIRIIPSSDFNTTGTAMDAITRDYRKNKKSKWDEVDSDKRAQEPVSSVSLRVASLYSNSGSGYSAYAEQKRQEAEDKRSSDRKSDRRS